MCAIGLPVDAGISALPSIIGPASVLLHRRESHDTWGCGGDDSLRSSRLSLHIEIAGRSRDASGPGTRPRDTPQAYQLLRPEETRSCSCSSLVGLGDIVLKYKSLPEVWVIIAGSIGMAVFVCAATGLLGRLGVRVRL